MKMTEPKPQTTEKDAILDHTLKLLFRARAILESCTGFGKDAEEARRQLLKEMEDKP